MGCSSEAHKNMIEIIYSNLYFISTDKIRKIGKGYCNYQLTMSIDTNAATPLSEPAPGSPKQQWMSTIQKASIKFYFKNLIKRYWKMETKTRLFHYEYQTIK